MARVYPTLEWLSSIATARACASVDGDVDRRQLHCIGKDPRLCYNELEECNGSVFGLIPVMTGECNRIIKSEAELDG